MDFSVIRVVAEKEAAKARLAECQSDYDRFHREFSQMLDQKLKALNEASTADAKKGAELVALMRKQGLID